MFSEHVQKAIDTGIVIPRARREIVQMLRTLMLQFTKEPTTEEYGTILRKLVLKYNTLQDDSKSGYVSYGILYIYILFFYIYIFYTFYTGNMERVLKDFF